MRGQLHLDWEHVLWNWPEGSDVVLLKKGTPSRLQQRSGAAGAYASCREVSGHFLKTSLAAPQALVKRPAFTFSLARRSCLIRRSNVKAR